MEQLTSIRGSQYEILENLIKKHAPRLMRIGDYIKPPTPDNKRKCNRTPSHLIKKAKKLLDEGWPVSFIAEALSLSGQTVRNIKRKLLTPSK